MTEPIPREELEPFTAPDKNITDREQRRYAALDSEIGDEPLIGDVMDDIEDEILDSRVYARGKTASYLSILPVGGGTGLYASQHTGALQDLMGVTADNPEMLAVWPAAAAAVAAGVYGKKQKFNSIGRFNDFIRELDQFDDYRMLEEYEVGRFDTIDEAEDLLWDADTVRYDVRMDELPDSDSLLADNDEAVGMYRDVLEELEDIHQDGVDARTADGVALYESEFLEPFYDEDEAAERAEAIKTSGAAQLLRTKETESMKDGTNPILHSDSVFRLEIVYSGETVATFEGTTDEDHEEIGEPLLHEDDRPSTYESSSRTGWSSAYRDGIEAFQQVAEQTGIQAEDDYRHGFLDGGGIPLHARDMARVLGRTVKSTGSLAGKAGKGLANALDYRQTDR